MIVMTEFERINTPRVEKILKMFEVIQTSARSSRAGNDEIAKLLSPVATQFSAGPRLSLDELDPPKDLAPGPVVQTTNSGLQGWADALDMARKAPLHDAVAAMGVIATRVEQELWEAQA
ncbi:MAG: hypothetical protein AAFX90_10210 [Pseudomonadota bacterium]